MTARQNSGSGRSGRIIIRLLLAVFGFAVGVGFYVWQYLGIASYRPIDIVKDLIPNGTVPSVPIGETDPPITDPNGNGGIPTATDGTGNGNGNGTEDGTGNGNGTEQTGRAPVGPVSGVYIHPNYPVREVPQKDSAVRNILVFGVDARSEEQVQARTDSIMILTLDKHQNNIKITSVMRDTEFVLDTQNRTSAKVNAAYVYGGVGLLINTLNTQLDLDIQEYMMLDFWSSAALVDEVGGIEIDVQEDEIQNFNQILNEMNSLFGDAPGTDHITHAGPQLINGKQAVSWARIRYVGTDFARTQRQRTIVETLIRKVADMNVLEQVRVGEALLSGVVTNINRFSMLDAGMTVLGGLHDIEQYRIPGDGLYETNTSNWNMIVDWDSQLPVFHEFIWE